VKTDYLNQKAGGALSELIRMQEKILNVEIEEL